MLAFDHERLDVFNAAIDFGRARVADPNRVHADADGANPRGAGNGN
jgi:hypothetical protein